LLGEAHNIRLNLQWEQTRYLATMMFNLNATKKAMMITPDKLFPLPQDIYLEKGKPRSTKEEFESFKRQVENATKISKD